MATNGRQADCIEEYTRKNNQKNFQHKSNSRSNELKFN